jgi:hypothetical protein
MPALTKKQTIIMMALMKKEKAAMTDEQLFQHLEGQLYNCPAPSCGGADDCNCLSILIILGVIRLVANYLLWFKWQPTEHQDSILLGWFIYHISLPHSKSHFSPMPFDGESIDDVDVCDDLMSHYWCRMGLQSVMGVGMLQWFCIRQASLFTSIMPLGRKKGNQNAKMQDDEPRLPMMLHHLSYLEKLGEVRAARVIATSVDGEADLSNVTTQLRMCISPLQWGIAIATSII